MLSRLCRSEGDPHAGPSRRANIVWTVAYDPDTSTRHKNPIYDQPDWAKDFDVVVHDECSSDVNDMNVVERILEPHRNGLPAVVLHCGMHSYRTEGWNKNVATPWMQFTGLISTGHGPQGAVHQVNPPPPVNDSILSGQSGPELFSGKHLRLRGF